MRIYFLILLLFSFFGGALASENIALNKTFENADLGYKVDYSSKFFKVLQDYRGVGFVEKKIPKAYKGKTYSMANFNIDVKRTNTDSLELKVEEYQKNIKKSKTFEDAELTLVEKVNFAGVEAYQIEGKAKVLNFYANWKMYILLHNNYYYEISCTTQKQRFQELLPIFDAMFATFAFTK